MTFLVLSILLCYLLLFQWGNMQNLLYAYVIRTAFVAKATFILDDCNLAKNLYVLVSAVI